MSVFEHLHMPSLGGATGWLNSEPVGSAELRGYVVLRSRSDSQRLRRNRAAVAVVAMLLLLAPSAAFGGGDEDHAPPSAGPPGPWDGPFGKKVPYRPSGTHRCRIDKAQGAGPGSVLGLFVERARCRDATRLVRAYQSCLDHARGRAGGCYDRVYRRCVQPVFLGRCRTSDRFFRRTVKGYRCTERRLYPIRGAYDANVACVKGSRRIDHSYTLFRGRRIAVGTEPELRAAWANPRFSSIEVTRDIVLHACELGDPIRESSRAVAVDGGGHTLRQACFEKRLLRQDGTGFVDLKNIELTRGGTDGPGAAVTTRGEIRVTDSKVHENLSEEPGGGIMSQRRATIIRSVITGNLANDDGGGVYARRGGIQVYDSVVSSNLVDGSGGALGSTGDILVVRSHIDGNTTDGDGGAIYTDEDGDVTVIDSTVNGSDADGPGGAIFTLDGDVTVVNSTVNGNRADDRGGAISGEADVTIINSTISHNAAVAHVGGGIWARSDLYIANSTISNNYAEGQGGGILAAGTVGLVNSTVIDNTAPVAANIGAGGVLKAFGSVIGPAKTDFTGAQLPPTETNCQVSAAESFGHNVVSDGSCGLSGASDMIGGLPKLGLLAANGGIGETRLPDAGSPVVDGIPAGECGFPPFGDVLEGEQHLEGLVEDRATLMTRDQRGISRPQGAGCDIGSVEVSQ
jgi:predicted outer membrane repeat protein